MSLQGHYITVQDKHQKLEALISSELLRPYPDLTMLQTLKKQKLLVKEELERIRHTEQVRREAA